MRRQERASLMIRISKGYCFLPYVNQIIEKEIRLEVLRRLGFPKIWLRNYVLKKGICYMSGVKPAIVKRKGAEVPNQPPDDLKKEMLDYLDTPEAMLTAFLIPINFDSKIRPMYEEVVEKMEKVRKNSSKTRDEAMGEFMIDMIGPIVARVLTKLKVPKDDVFFKEWAKRDFDEFIDHIPTALCLFTLLQKRDQQLDRPIQVNDIADVWALSLAIPYSDIVVTEKMWASIAMKETKLAEKCNTKILKSIDELISLLRF